MKWIDVNEELPNRSGLYLIFSPSLDDDFPLVIAITYRPEEGWNGLPRQWLEAITHWGEVGRPDGITGFTNDYYITI